MRGKSVRPTFVGEVIIDVPSFCPPYKSCPAFLSASPSRGSSYPRAGTCGRAGREEVRVCGCAVTGGGTSLCVGLQTERGRRQLSPRRFRPPSSLWASQAHTLGIERLMTPLTPSTIAHLYAYSVTLWLLCDQRVLLWQGGCGLRLSGLLLLFLLLVVAVAAVAVAAAVT